MCLLASTLPAVHPATAITSAAAAAAAAAAALAAAVPAVTSPPLALPCQSIVPVPQQLVRVSEHQELSTGRLFGPWAASKAL